MLLEPALWARAYLQGYCRHSNCRSLRPFLTETPPITFYGASPAYPLSSLESGYDLKGTSWCRNGTSWLYLKDLFCCWLEMVRRFSVVKSRELVKSRVSQSRPVLKFGARPLLTEGGCLVHYCKFHSVPHLHPLDTCQQHFPVVTTTKASRRS